MKNLTSLLVLVATILLAVSTAHAQAIVSAWTWGNTASPTLTTDAGTYVFLSNGVYFQAEIHSGGVGNGMERGTYTYNSGTGLFTLVSIAVDTNGAGAGLSTVGVGNTQNVTITGDIAGPPFDLARVTGANPIVGAWTYGNTLSPTSAGTGAFVFLANGTYFQMESENTGDALGGQNGMELGTYSFVSATSTFTFNSVVVNTNGGWGLSDLTPGDTLSIVITGDSAIANGSTTLTRVTAIPEPSICGVIGGFATLGLALWRRRRAADQGR